MGVLQYSRVLVIIALVGVINCAFKHHLPELPYLKTQLEPYIRTQIMELHHEKHHQGYVKNLNIAMEDLEAEAKDRSMEQQMSSQDIHDNIWNIMKVKDDDIRTRLRNFGGGHINHSFFWKLLIPSGNVKFINEFSEVHSMIQENFGSYEEFKKRFEKASMKLFGSGWAWLVLNTEKDTLEIITTANQDHPQMFNRNQVPIFGIDLWEHAYYLQHYSDRSRYLTTIWMIVNWQQVETNLISARVPHDYEDLQRFDPLFVFNIFGFYFG